MSSLFLTTFSSIFQRVCMEVSSCPPGSALVRTGSDSDVECSSCAAGHVDDDSDPETPCVWCEPGGYVPPMATGACAGYTCPPGTIDDDTDPATPCNSCAVGSYQPLSGRFTCLPLTECPAGSEWVAGSGSPTSDRQCTPCVLGDTYKKAGGIDSKCEPVTLCGVGFEVSRCCGEGTAEMTYVSPHLD